MNAEICELRPRASIVSRLSLSPDSSKPGSTAPQTPECSTLDCDFGGVKHAHSPSAGMTPTPPPSVEGPGIFSRLEAYHHAAVASPFPVAAINFGLGSHSLAEGNIWPSRSIPRGISLGQSGDLSHIWANRQTTPPHGVPQAAQGQAHHASHLSWGSVDSQGSRYGPAQNIHRAAVTHQQPLRYRQHVQPVDDALNFWGQRVVQDLGVDVLRISSPPASHHAHYAHHALGRPVARFVNGYLPRENMTVPLAETHPQRLHESSINTVATGFTPMHAVNEQTRTAFNPHGTSTPHQLSTRLSASLSTRFSTRYHGMHTDANASAEHLAPEHNCALWLTNLPPDVTARQLLGAIRRVGRIWCSFINYPDYQSHHTAAAKVVFFTPKATQQFLRDSWTKGLYIGTNRVRVSHNRIKSESKEDELATPKSRVLIITGRAEFVNEAYLTKYFKDRFIFQNDEVTELINAGGRAVLEWKFGSYRCQSQMGKMSLEKDRPYWLEKVEFGEDPCEVGDTLSSYGIAAERIQGRGL